IGQPRDPARCRECPDERLPDGAVRLVEIAGDRVHLHHEATEEPLVQLGDLVVRQPQRPLSVPSTPASGYGKVVSGPSQATTTGSALAGSLLAGSLLAGSLL